MLKFSIHPACLERMKEDLTTRSAIILLADAHRTLKADVVLLAPSVLDSMDEFLDQCKQHGIGTLDVLRGPSDVTPSLQPVLAHIDADRDFLVTVDPLPAGSTSAFSVSPLGAIDKIRSRER